MRPNLQGCFLGLLILATIAAADKSEIVSEGGAGGTHGDFAALHSRLEQLEELAFSQQRAGGAEHDSARRTGEQSLLEVFGNAARKWLLEHLARASDHQVRGRSRQTSSV